MATSNRTQVTITNHSFVIRLWVEEWVGEQGLAKWRGHIIHVPSQRDKYFDDFAIIVSFILASLNGNPPSVPEER